MCKKDGIFFPSTKSRYQGTFTIGTPCTEERPPDSVLETLALVLVLLGFYSRCKNLCCWLQRSKSRVKDFFNSREAAVKQMLRIQNYKNTTDWLTKINNKTKPGTVSSLCFVKTAIKAQILWSENLYFTFLFLALRVSNSFKRNAVSVCPPKSAASFHGGINLGISMVLHREEEKKKNNAKPVVTSSRVPSHPQNKTEITKS